MDMRLDYATYLKTGGYRLSEECVKKIQDTPCATEEYAQGMAILLKCPELGLPSNSMVVCVGQMLAVLRLYPDLKDPLEEILTKPLQTAIECCCLLGMQ